VALIDMTKLNAKQKQIYEQFKDDPDFDMERALEKFAKAPTQARKVQKVTDTKEASSRELRLVVELLHRKIELVQRDCKECSRTFACDFLYVAFCSDACRAANLYRTMGITWDSTKSERERWGGEPPSTIKPETLQQLIAFAQAILALPTAADYVGRNIPSVLAGTGSTSNQNIKSIDNDGITPKSNNTSQAHVHNMADARIEAVKQVRESDEVKALKEKLASGELSKIEYQLALADLF